VPPGLEADDVLASAAAYARTVDARTVVVTSDRDSFALVDDNTRMLRIIDGGVEASPMLDPRRLAMVTGVRAEQYLDLAALRGDTSDNLPGVPGIGPRTAARLLAAFDTAEAAFDDAAAEGARCRDAVGTAVARKLARPEARERWAFNRQVMAMRRDAHHGLDLPAGRGCLPLEEASVRRAYSLVDLHVPSAVRGLTGREPSLPRPVDVSAAWRPPRQRSMRFPPLPRRPEPAYVQDTLF
jgi:DNA polymerase-1